VCGADGAVTSEGVLQSDAEKTLAAVGTPRFDFSNLKGPVELRTITGRRETVHVS
jgi:hypothetical protein